MTQQGLADAITEAVYVEYDKLKHTNKPRVKSNGVKECTVLASIVAINKHEVIVNPRVLIITTGMKATPDFDLARSGGKMVHDCHAEILALRGFNAMLLDEMIQVKNGNESPYLINLGEKYKWNPKWSLALFISRLPCGDASMDSIESTTEEEKLLNMSDDDPYQYLSPSCKRTLRGRFNFNKKGYVRTKPGRQDSNITLSKSCSDKICLRQVTSLNNALTYGLMKEPIYLDYMVLPHINVEAMASLKRCFEDRLEGCMYPIHSFQVLPSEKLFKDDISKEKDPNGLSVIKLYMGQNGTPLEQSILNGVKNGSYTKANKPLRNNCQPLISRYALWRKYIQLNPNWKKGYPRITTYDEFKRDYNKERNEMVNSVKKLLVKNEDWIPTYSDNFNLE